MSRMSNSDNYHQTGAHTVATARARREIGKWSIDQITAAVRYVVHKGTVWTGDLEMSVLKHLQDNAQSVRGHHPAGPNGYRHVLDARIWIRAPPAPQVPLSPETVVDHARIGELPERTARQQQHLEQHDPCADGPNNMVYRCQLCDEKDGPIAWDTIGHGNGICVDKKCYNYNNLIEWLHTQEDQDVNVMATIPHSRRELSSEELLSTPMSPAPPNGCTGGHIRESYIPPAFHELTGGGTIHNWTKTIAGGKKRKKYKKMKKSKKNRRRRRKKTRRRKKRRRRKTKRRRLK